MVDRYTKIVLTIIAAALVALAFQSLMRPTPAFGQRDVVDVRIRGIDEASSLRWEAIRVICDNCR